jgi:hypothetical protein
VFNLVSLGGGRREVADRNSSDAGVLRTANRWIRPMAFGTMADALVPILAAFCFMPVLLMAVVTVSGAGIEGMAAQCILAAGAFVSLRLLKEYPMVNPLHAMILVFHWWFGYGPSVCALFWLWKGDSTRVDVYVTGAILPILIVALGLPLYAWAARFVLGHWSRFQLTPAAPPGATYDMATFLRLALVAVLAGLSMRLLAFFGVEAFEAVNYLGGQQVKTWWLVPLAETVRLTDFVVAAACSFLAIPNLRKSAAMRWIMFGIILFALQRALTSGSKGPLVMPAFYFIVAFVNWRRKLPWPVLALALCGYLFVVEPFVTAMRMRAETHKAVTTAERVEIFSEGWRDFQIGGSSSGRDVNIESLFRGIYPLAKDIADRSSFTGGPWRGQSLVDGLSSLLPRALFPNKASTNMGNFFARQLGASEARDYMTNIAITVPFEVVGNYGWVAGCLSFAVMGAAWAALIAFVLTVPRMTTHPLAPFMIGLAMLSEQSFGQFANSIKVMAIPLAVLYVVCWVGRRTTRDRVPVLVRQTPEVDLACDSIPV